MEQHRFPQTIDQFEGGLSLDQIATFARQHVLLIACCVVLGSAISLGTSLTLPKEWQATNTLQMGQVTRSSVTIAGSSVVTEPIETGARAVERLTLPQFQDDVLRRLGLPLSRAVSSRTSLIRDYVTINLTRNSPDLVSIGARGYSQDEARHIVQAYQTRLIEVHKALLQPSLDRASSELAQSKTSLVSLEQVRTQLESMANGKSSGDDKTISQNVLRQIMLQSTKDEIWRLQARIRDLKEDMNPERTYNTRPLIDVIAVSDKPVFPKKSVFGGVGALIGFVVGIGISLLKDRRIVRAAAPRE